MWSEKSAPLRLDLRRSPRLTFLLCLLNGGALGLLALLPLPWWLTAGGAALVLVSAAAALARHALLLDPRAVQVVMAGDGAEWTLIERGGARHTVRLVQDSYVHPWLTILNFSGRPRRSVLVLPDRVDREAFRRLRVRLRLYGAE